MGWVSEEPPDFRDQIYVQCYSKFYTQVRYKRKILKFLETQIDHERKRGEFLAHSLL